MFNENEYPSSNWYLSRSHDLSLDDHCPHRSSNRCPRYYDSLVALELKIEHQSDQEYLKEWRLLCPDYINHDKPEVLWEEIDRNHREIKFCDNMCPEVMYSFSKVGQFVKLISFIKDNNDKMMEVDSTSMHFTTCPIYICIESNQDHEYKMPENPNLVLLSGYKHIRWTNPDNGEVGNFILNHTQEKIIEVLHHAEGYSLHNDKLKELSDITASKFQMHKYFKVEEGRGTLIVSVMKGKKGSGVWRLNI